MSRLQMPEEGIELQHTFFPRKYYLLTYVFITSFVVTFIKVLFISIVLAETNRSLFPKKCDKPLK